MADHNYLLAAVGQPEVPVMVRALGHEPMLVVAVPEAGLHGLGARRA